MSEYLVAGDITRMYDTAAMTECDGDGECDNADHVGHYSPVDFAPYND
jgi:hypothetical protein